MVGLTPFSSSLSFHLPVPRRSEMTDRQTFLPLSLLFSLLVDLTETSNTVFNAPPKDLSLDFEAFPELPAGKHRVFIMTVGSRGDVQPYLAFANELISRGHQVGVLTNSIFRSFVKVRSPFSFSFLIFIILLFLFLFVSINQNARSEEEDAEERD